MLLLCSERSKCSLNWITDSNSRLALFKVDYILAKQSVPGHGHCLLNLFICTIFINENCSYCNLIWASQLSLRSAHGKIYKQPEIGKSLNAATVFGSMKAWNRIDVLTALAGFTAKGLNLSLSGSVVQSILQSLSSSAGSASSDIFPHLFFFTPVLLGFQILFPVSVPLLLLSHSCPSWQSSFLYGVYVPFDDSDKRLQGECKHSKFHLGRKPLELSQEHCPANVSVYIRHQHAAILHPQNTNFCSRYHHCKYLFWQLK